VEMFDVGGSFEFGGHAVGVGLGLGVGNRVVGIGEDVGDPFGGGDNGGGDVDVAVGVLLSGLLVGDGGANVLALPLHAYHSSKQLTCTM
jgi:hypothetical protein